jgi:ATP-dependent Lon protease
MKKNFNKYLKTTKSINSINESNYIFDSHIGYSDEKSRFKEYNFFYYFTNGNFFPKRNVVCYYGPPGTGKTTFVNVVAKSTGRDLIIVSCSGSNSFENFSILGDENKPSLIYHAIEKSESNNPIIVFDELEKVEENSEIQKDLITLFELYKNDGEEKSKVFHDKFSNVKICLDKFNFFATVNYLEMLVPLLKNEILIENLGEYCREDKLRILEIKSREIDKIFKDLFLKDKKNIISQEIVALIPDYIHESGIRRSEGVLKKISKDFIYNFAIKRNDEYCIEDPKI